MLAVFKNKNFVGLWHRIVGDATWLERTASAIGARPNEIEAYECPPQRADASYGFQEIDGDMHLIVYSRAFDENGDPVMVPAQTLKLQKV
jgi:hypothetical protein